MLWEFTYDALADGLNIEGRLGQNDATPERESRSGTCGDVGNGQLNSRGLESLPVEINQLNHGMARRAAPHHGRICDPTLKSPQPRSTTSGFSKHSKNSTATFR